MCLKAKEGVIWDHLISSPFVIQIWLLVVGKKEVTRGSRVSRGFSCTIIETKGQGTISRTMGTIMDDFGTSLLQSQ